MNNQAIELLYELLIFYITDADLRGGPLGRVEYKCMFIHYSFNKNLLKIIYQNKPHHEFVEEKHICEAVLL